MLYVSIWNNEVSSCFRFNENDTELKIFWENRFHNKNMNEEKFRHNFFFGSLEMSNLYKKICP